MFLERKQIILHKIILSYLKLLLNYIVLNQIKVLLVLLSRSVAFYCTEYRKKLSFSKKQLLMQFVMIIQKVLSDRKWMGFDEDGLYSNYLRFCKVLHTKPRRFARYLHDALEEGVKHAAD